MQSCVTEILASSAPILSTKLPAFCFSATARNSCTVSAKHLQPSHFEIVRMRLSSSASVPSKSWFAVAIAKPPKVGRNKGKFAVLGLNSSFNDNAVSDGGRRPTHPYRQFKFGAIRQAAFGKFLMADEHDNVRRLAVLAH